jgi:hypothetical protein
MTLDPAAKTIISDKLLMDLRDAHVFKLGTNQNYEDEIRSNAVVKILSAGRPTTQAYTREGTITWERIPVGEQFFVVDQRQYFARKVDNLEKHLAAAGGKIIAEELRGGAWELADDVDDFIRDMMSTATPSTHTLTARTIGLGLNASAYDLLVDLSTTLDDYNVPRTGRHVFINPSYKGFLTKDPRWTSFNTAEAQKNIRGAPIGMVEDLEVHVSNNLAVSGTTYTIQAAWDQASTYGEQLEETQMFDRFEDSFDQGYRSELVFGGKVVIPRGLAKCAVQFAV